MSTLAALDLDPKMPDVVEVRGRLFCRTPQAVEVVLAATEQGGHFIDTWTPKDVGELISESGDPIFWADGALLDVIDFSKWGKLEHGYDLSLLLTNMVDGLEAEDWDTILDQLDAFLQHFTWASVQEWRDLVGVLRATHLSHRCELLKQFGLGEVRS